VVVLDEEEEEEEEDSGGKRPCEGCSGKTALRSLLSTAASALPREDWAAEPWEMVADKTPVRTSKLRRLLDTAEEKVPGTALEGTVLLFSWEGCVRGA